MPDFYQTHECNSYRAKVTVEWPAPEEKDPKPMTEQAEDPRNLVLAIKSKIKCIGPGFAVSVSAKPGEWQALLDAIPGPGMAPAPGEEARETGESYRRRVVGEWGGRILGVYHPRRAFT